MPAKQKTKDHHIKDPLMEAVTLDCAGVVAMLLSILLLPPLFGFIVPLLVYMYSYWYFPKEFWRAWIVSAVFLVLLVLILGFLGWYEPLGNAIIVWGRKLLLV